MHWSPGHRFWVLPACQPWYGQLPTFLSTNTPDVKCQWETVSTPTKTQPFISDQQSWIIGYTIKIGSYWCMNQKYARTTCGITEESENLPANPSKQGTRTEVEGWSTGNLAFIITSEMTSPAEMGDMDEMQIMEWVLEKLEGSLRLTVCEAVCTSTNLILTPSELCRLVQLLAHKPATARLVR